MSEILEALGNLYKSIDGLETAAEARKASRKNVPQHDLFGIHQDASFDTALLAKNLDAMIGKLELVLKEG